MCLYIYENIKLILANCKKLTFKNPVIKIIIVVVVVALNM